MPYLTRNVGAEVWASFVLEGLSNNAVVLAAGARRIVTSAKSIHVPVAGTPSTAWLDELEEIREDDAVPTEAELTPFKVGNLSVASNEAIGDASVDVLDTIGDVAVRAISLAVDKALLTGRNSRNTSGVVVEPLGLTNIAGVSVDRTNTPDTYAGLMRASGPIRAAGGRPDTVFLGADDYLALTLAEDGMNRPLTQNVGDAPTDVIGGMRLWPTPALSRGNAVIAQAEHILVAVRDDPRVDISTDAKFGADAVLIRTIARVDVNVADTDGLVIIAPRA